MTPIGHFTINAEYNLFYSVHGEFIKLDHIWGHEASLEKFQSIKVMKSMFYDHKSSNLDMNNKIIKKTFHIIQYEASRTLPERKKKAMSQRNHNRNIFQFNLNCNENATLQNL